MVNMVFQYLNAELREAKFNLTNLKAEPSEATSKSSQNGSITAINSYYLNFEYCEAVPHLPLGNTVPQYLNSELREAKFNLTNLKAEFGEATSKS